MSYFDALKFIMPELAVTLGLLVVLAWDMFARQREGETAILSLGFLGITAGLILQRLGWDALPQTVFGMVRVDSFALCFKLFITTAVAIVIALDLMDRKAARSGRPESQFLLLTAVLGSFFLVGADNLILLYLGLETLGLSSYALSGMHKRSPASAEAALKYVVYGAFASGILLFGASLLYGLTGTLDLGDMGRPVLEALDRGDDIPVALSFLLILVGFGFKLSLFPFQWWAPDVYQGVTTPIATFLAVGSKGVALAAFLRFLAAVFGPLAALEDPYPILDSIRSLLALVAAMTILFGNLAAIRQNNLKRLLAYSSIAHAGYITMGVALLSEEGFAAATLYTFIYYLMNFGAFATVIYFANQTGSEEIESLRGMGYRHPWAGAAAVVFLASLTGLPPTAGFAGKYYLIQAAWAGGLGWLALIAVVLSVVSLFYYFRIAKMLFLRQREDEVPVLPARTLTGLLVVLAVLSIVFLDFEPIYEVAVSGVASLF